jgi:ribonuclease HI
MQFSPDDYVGRVLDNDESVEVPMGPFTTLYNDESNTTIIAIDGACRDNGRSGARAALGVFFAAGSTRWNKSELLPERDVTSQRAELCAALRALRLVQDLISHEWYSSYTNSKPLKRVIIKSDSDYLVQSMTNYIIKWQGNGYTAASGQQVKNQDLFKEVLTVVENLGNQKNIQTLFWKVRRKLNADADRLANAALDAAAAPTWNYDASNARQGMTQHVSENVWRWHTRMGHQPLEVC